MLGSGSGGSLLALVLLSFCNEPVELEVDDDQLTPLRRQYRSTLTATGFLSLSLHVPLREIKPDKSAVLSPPIPRCPPMSLKENGSSGSVNPASNPSPAVSRNLLFFRENAEVTKPLAGARCGVDLEKCLELLSEPSLLLDRADLLAEVAFEGL